MADDHRYDWLDDDAVERVLRGESVVAECVADADRSPDDAPDKAARLAAERLDAALRSLTTPLPDGPLPGEEAALAAFREARAAAGAPAAAPPAAHRAGPSGVVRSFLRRRPLNTALALALAGCAVGGVAVAAGAGVLPVPFGRGGKEPTPASSVTVAGGGTETLGPGTPGPRVTPSPGASGGRHTAEPDAYGSRRPGTATPGGTTPAPDRGPTATPHTGTGDDTADKDKGRDKSDDAETLGSRAWAAKVCREFLTHGKKRGGGPGVGEEEMRTLERSAGGPGAVDLRAYCEEVLSLLDSSGGDAAGAAGGPATGGARTLPRTRSRPHTSLPLPPATPGVTLFDASAL
ncbi:hypothetical protein [Streptomyces sp. NPDC046261]|uniref:hypothetical protein n=1 Tax=Streptomyces sp. NPDC046261 TaxID=3157200 RepID=UPI0033D680A1